MLGDGVVIQQVLLAAMDTTCLHLLKLPRPFLMVQLTPPALREGLPAGRPAPCNYATIVVSKSGRRVLVSEHISRKERKHDRVRESIEHGAEAVLSHTRIASIVLLAAIVLLSGYYGWKIYGDRQTAQAQAAFDEAMTIFNAQILLSGQPGSTAEVSYTD